METLSNASINNSQHFQAIILKWCISHFIKQYNSNTSNPHTPRKDKYTLLLPYTIITKIPNMKHVNKHYDTFTGY